MDTTNQIKENYYFRKCYIFFVLAVACLSVPVVFHYKYVIVLHHTILC